jgi:anti-anti-sigma factor
MADMWCTVVWTCCEPPVWRGLEPRPVPAQTRAELPPLYMISTVAGGLRCVAVGGELDLATVPLLDAAVAEAFRTGSAVRGATTGRFLLDLSGVSFMDASALTALNRIDRFVRRRGEELSLIAPVASGPRRLLLLAVGREWLSPAFTPVHPEDRVAQLARP